MLLENAFRKCGNLNKISYHFENEAEAVSAFIIIGNSAFQDCTALKNLDFLIRVYSIGSRAFYGCNSIEGILKLPTTVGKLGNEVFSSPLITGAYIQRYVSGSI